MTSHDYKNDKPQDGDGANWLRVIFTGLAFVAAAGSLAFLFAVLAVLLGD
jgi:hypothetical protein